MEGCQQLSGGMVDSTNHIAASLTPNRVLGFRQQVPDESRETERSQQVGETK